jgi:hypothetical protein
MLPAMRRRHLPSALALLLPVGVRAQAPRTWTVGEPGGPASLAEALRLAQDGDTVALAPGVHRGGGVVTQARLTLRGLGPGAVLDGRDSALPEGKALVVARGGALRVENLGFRGARVPDGNGAGIRLERGRLQVLGCHFSDNEMGLLTSNAADVALAVSDSLFEQAPPDRGRGLHHLLYIGAIAQATVRGCRFRFGAAGGQGHLLKCRAREAEVSGCDLGWDDPQGTASYELDFPNGGRVTVRGNRIAQGANSPNRTMLAYGAEARPGAVGPHHLVIDGNAFRSEGTPAQWWRVWAERLGPALAVEARDNRREGSGRAVPEPPGAFA